ncbi:GPR endopeptidase, partial [Klebsiella oxytoca]
TTIQLSDTGIIPGSGVGNHRAALNRETLGVPVFAIGVPTVVDAATLAADLLEESGVENVRPESLQKEGQGL